MGEYEEIFLLLFQANTVGAEMQVVKYIFVTFLRIQASNVHSI